LDEAYFEKVKSLNVLTHDSFGKKYRKIAFWFQIEHLDVNYQNGLSVSFDEIVPKPYNLIHIPWPILNEIHIPHTVNTHTT
jgi:hypothetical protein